MSKAWQNLTLQDFPYITDEQVRFGDTDSIGHVNNTAFVAFLETGRISMNSGKGITSRIAKDNCSFVVAQLNLGYHGEITWPNKIKVGAGIKKIGRTSVTVYQGVFLEEQCMATAEVVLVLMNRQTRKSAPLPDDIRPVFEELIVSFDL